MSNGFGLTGGLGIAVPGPYARSFYKWTDDKEKYYEEGIGVRISRFYLYIGLTYGKERDYHETYN